MEQRENKPKEMQINEIKTAFSKEQRLLGTTKDKDLNEAEQTDDLFVTFFLISLYSMRMRIARVFQKNRCYSTESNVLNTKCTTQ